jgi:hypothetical protein
VTNGFVDDEPLVTWVLHLTDPAGGVRGEDDYARMGRAWRLEGTAPSV